MCYTLMGIRELGVCAPGRAFGLSRALCCDGGKPAARDLKYHQLGDIMENPEMQLQQIDEQEIDLLEVFHVLWSKVWLLLASTVLGAVVVGLVTFFFITPKYEASSIIYILSKTTSITSVADLQLGSQLAADFQIIATTREVVQVVMDQFGITEPYGRFVKSIEVTNPTDSHMLQITVTNEDPELAAQLSNALADQMRLQIADVMNTDTPSTVERAVVPEKPSSPRLLMDAAIGGMVFLVLAAGLVLVQHFMDDTVKDETDVQKYLGLNTLAAIPMEHDYQDARSAKKSGNKKKKAKA